MGAPPAAWASSRRRPRCLPFRVCACVATVDSLDGISDSVGTLVSALTALLGAGLTALSSLAGGLRGYRQAVKLFKSDQFFSAGANARHQFVGCRQYNWV